MACGGSRPPNKVRMLWVGEMTECLSEGLTDFYVWIKQKPSHSSLPVAPGVSSNLQGHWMGHELPEEQGQHFQPNKFNM